MPFSDELAARTVDERAEFLGQPFFRDLAQGAPFSLKTYATFLELAHHHVKWTAPLYGLVLSRLANADLELRRAIVYYIQDELGHEQWIERDLSALGVGDVGARLGNPHPVVQRFVDYLAEIAAQGHPLALLGMSYVLEHQSVEVGPGAVSLLQAQHALPDEALTYLHSHAVLDVEHTRMQRDLLDTITDATAQHAIADCAKRTYQLYGDLFRHLQAAREGVGALA